MCDNAYEGVINFLIDSKSDSLLPNGCIDHARSLIRLMVGRLEIKEYIGIFTGSLDQDAFGSQETIDVFKKRLSEGIKLKILFQNLDFTLLENNPFYLQIVKNKDFQDKIEARVLLDEHSENDRHILTINDNAFRFETDHSNKKAVAGFNNPLGAKVRSYFNSLMLPEYSKAVSF